MTGARDAALRVRARLFEGLATARAGLRVVGEPLARRGPEIVVAVGLVLSALGVLVLVGAARNDAKIESDTGVAVAEVLAGSSSQRTYVRFTAADGAVLTPEEGVFYPRGLEAGALVLVEYDRSEPELVRVAGRNWTVGLLPVALGVLGVWVVAVPAAVGLSRWRRRAAAGRGGPADDEDVGQAREMAGAGTR